MIHHPKRILSLLFITCLSILSMPALFFMLNEQNVLAAPTGTDICFTSLDNSNTTFASTSDASAVQSAVDAVTDGGLVKIAGTCKGAWARSDLTQTVYISKSITLQGGYTATNWAALANPALNPTTLDATHVPLADSPAIDAIPEGTMDVAQHI